jgi:hypothetical protein
MGNEYRDRFLAALLVMVSCFVLWQDPEQGQVYGLYLGVFVYVALGIFLINRPLGLFMLYIAGYFGWWVSLHFVGRMEGIVVGLGIDAILFMTFAAIIYKGVVKSALPDETFISGICWFVLLEAALAICQYHFFDPVGTGLGFFIPIGYGEYSANTPAGTFSNTNYIGAAMGIGFWFFFRRKWWLAVPVIAYALFIVNCRAVNIPILAVGLFLIYWGGLKFTDFTVTAPWTYRGTNTLLTIGFLYLAYWLVMQNIGSLVERYNEFWKESLNYWLSGRFDFWMTHNVRDWFSSNELPPFKWGKFLFGTGPGITMRPVNNNLHCEPLTWVCNYGLLGASIIGAFIVTTLWKIRKNVRLMCVLVIALADMTVNHLLHIPLTGLLMVFVMALAQRKINSALSPKTIMARSI